MSRDSITSQKPDDAVSQFAIHGKVVSIEPYGSGHIHDTYLVTSRGETGSAQYILQRINHEIFTNPPAVMANVLRVSDHLASKAGARNGDTLSLVPTVTQEPYLQDDSGNFWRVYVYIPDSRSFDVIPSPRIAYGAAKSFGEFQSDLVDLPGPRLVETIPDFHDTPKRVRDFEKAVELDTQGRASEVQLEIQFVRDRADESAAVMQGMREGLIPERIVHNDTKFNNVLFNEKTEQPICVIDLDTVMPGSILFDFGDMVRTATSPAAEDELDLSRVGMQHVMFKALVEGYLEGAASFLTHSEVALLPFSGKLITYEIGMRFLTDHLSGDKYFKIHRENHNLDRCRTQFKLVESIESQLDDMIALVESRWNEIRKDDPGRDQ